MERIDKEKPISAKNTIDFSSISRAIPHWFTIHARSNEVFQWEDIYVIKILKCKDFHFVQFKWVIHQEKKEK